MKLPRFRLRTLLIVIALLAIPMGWWAYQLNWIRQRHKFLESHPMHMTNATVGGHSVEAPWQLRLFGESTIGYIHAPKTDIPEATLLFPEAIVNDRRSPFEPEPNDK